MTDLAGMDAVRALYRASAAVADHHAPEIIEALHVGTAVDDFVVAQANDRGIVFVTGNPGDGKTHLIRRAGDRLAGDVVVCLDANERPNDELARLIDSALSGSHGLVIAINEGILLDLVRSAADRPWAADVRAKLLGALTYDGSAEAGLSRVHVVDLNLRNTLGPEVVGHAIDRVLALAGDCPHCAGRRCQAMLNAERWRTTPVVRQRLVELLDVVGASGVHATMRDLLALLAFALTAGRACPQVSGQADAEPYYVNLFEGGSGPLFEALRRFDPLRRPRPLLDDALWRGTDDTADWLVDDAVAVRREGEEEAAFRRRKRRAFFEHRLGADDLRQAGDEVDALLRAATDANRRSARALVALINRFFDRASQEDDVLHLWTAHRYDARPTRHAAARWHISTTQLRLAVPALASAVAPAFPDHRPDHSLLVHAAAGPAAGLVIDRALLGELAGAHVGGPRAMASEPAARLAAFFDQLARLARADWAAAPTLPEVRVIDLQAARKVVLGVDLETRSYVRL